MREIKFRFWDGSQMVENKDISYIDFNNKFITVKDKYHDTYKQIDFTEGTLMEYTGLNDRTGKEIYEGDIVRRECLDLFYEGGPIIGIVKMIDGNWLIEVDYFNGIILYNDIDSNEVVGNIFENENLKESLEV